MAERVIPDGEVHAVLARVAASTSAWPRARGEVALALALAPTNPRVLEQRIVTETTPEARVAAARELTVSNPELASGWLLLALSLPQGDAERVVDLEQALSKNPGSFLALSELAQRRCAEGHCAEAVALAERAVTLAPEDIRVLSACAAVQSKAGQCAGAVATQERALGVLSHRASVQQKQQLLARLAEYQGCR